VRVYPLATSQAVRVKHLFGSMLTRVLEHLVTMRVVPTAIEYSTQAISVENFGSIAITALTINGQCQTQPITLTATVASGATQFRPYDLSNNNSASGYVALSAEL
jgi:hypothetical protein